MEEELNGLLQSAEAHSPDELIPIVYEELRRLARRCMRHEASGQTIQPTALVHEAFLRLVGSEAPWESRAHFFCVAAAAMRRLLIDRARRRRALRRGGGRRGVALEDAKEPALERDEYVVALDDALTELASVDAPLSRLIELRFFAGLSVEETGEVLGISPATVKRRWRLGKAWLHRQIAGDG